MMKEEDEQPGLIDLVFSWSIADIINKDLYRDKVDPIPDTFSSSDNYLESFVNPLLEEIHADLNSEFSSLHSAPTCEIFDVEKISNNNLFYSIVLWRSRNSGGNPRRYKPEFGDLIALTGVEPNCIDDLSTPKRQYTVALVQSMKNQESITISILSSQPIVFEKGVIGNRLFAVHLTNMITNMRIWKSLHPGFGGNRNIINSVLSTNPSLEEKCTLCSFTETESLRVSKSRENINSFGLNDSQKAAVLNCIALTECRHENRVKLIWGPPGTGKTKTVASLLFALLKMKCRTLTCAPTNIAVVGVTRRLMSCLSGTLEYDTYGLGDIILFGNGKRMKINEHEELYNVFLENRVSVLAHCFAPFVGWKGCLDRMVSLLEDPQSMYLLYLEQQKEIDKKDEMENTGTSENFQETSKRDFLKKLVIQNKRENKKKKSKQNVPKQEESKSVIIPMTFEDFFMKKFFSLRKKLFVCTTGLYTHLPTSCLPLEVVKNMIAVLDMLRLLENFLRTVNITNDGCVQRALFGVEETGLCRTRLKCLKVLKLLRLNFSVPNFIYVSIIKNFCLTNACLLFCTVSSSVKLYTKEMTPLGMVIIDEAAQLKECESSIPLQLPGLRHAVLVGDEKQLPAMVISKICEEAAFGRSLFERLVKLGHKKHLLNIQYRMHPSISLFPNNEFYGNRINDGPNVRKRAYEKIFLEEKIYGSFSFVNITNGKEELDNRHSLRNIVEVSVVVEIVSKLYKETMKSKKRVRVGCISPYNAQVYAIQESLEKANYSTDANDLFSVYVRSVDGFQGSEEDVIIISTVRCNGSGSIGFLDDRQRANVALTRARYCLWILGNGATLLNSDSIWRKLVLDAKKRGCYFNAYEDKNVSLAISNALIQLNELNSLFCMDSMLFKMSNWKICFSAQFHESITRFHDTEIHKAAVSVLVKISNGWRQLKKKDENAPKNFDLMGGASSQLLELYDVKGPIKLVWTIEILIENSIEKQVIKVLDILPRWEILELAKKFDAEVRNYTMNQMSRCLCKQIQRGLMHPMTWPVDHGKKSTSNELATHLGAMTLRDAPSSSTTRYQWRRINPDRSCN
ncbi:hypothetical protein ABFS83_08G214400 [Erythranthe nasuta]